MNCAMWLPRVIEKSRRTIKRKAHGKQRMIPVAGQLLKAIEGYQTPAHSGFVRVVRVFRFSVSFPPPVNIKS